MPDTVNTPAPAAAPAGQQPPAGGNEGSSQPQPTPEEVIAALQAKNDELANQYQNLQSVLGRQGEELGFLRDVTQRFLTDGREAAGAEDDAGEIDQEAEAAWLADLEEQVQNGELSPVKAMAMVRDREREQYAAAQEAMKKNLPTLISEGVQQQRRREAIDNWVQQTPGFADAYRSGELTKALNEGVVPFADNEFGVWLAKENQNLRTEIERVKAEAAAALEAARQAGVQDAMLSQDRLNQGAAAASTVLGQPGSQVMTDRPPKNASAADKRNWAVARAQARRAGTG